MNLEKQTAEKVLPLLGTTDMGNATAGFILLGLFNYTRAHLVLFVLVLTVALNSVMDEEPLSDCLVSHSHKRFTLGAVAPALSTLSTQEVWQYGILHAVCAFLVVPDAECFCTDLLPGWVSS
ncbi:hypothetical protein ACRRTK_006784 [Alexandromys fortis]